MASSTTKKVLIRRFDREPLVGFINPQVYLRGDGIEVLTTGGAVSLVPYEEVKTVCFVKDFDAVEQEPERKVFNTRPKMEGLWIRFHFRDAEVMEGVMPNNLLPVDPHGFTVIPPDPYSNHQRVFIPRAALRSVEVLGVVGSPLKKRKEKIPAKEQIGLFDE